MVVHMDLGGRVTVRYISPRRITPGPHIVFTASPAKVQAEPVSAARPYTQDVVTAGLECLLEGRSELSVEIRVDQRIERGVEVAYPEDCGYHHRRTVAHLVAAQGRDDVPAMETDL
jgi:hypothetical protein